MASEQFELQAVDGEIYAHVFENRTTGVPLGLYWNLYVECGDIEVEGEAWQCGVSCDWLQWSVSNWHELDGLTLGIGGAGIDPQCSFYLAQHHPAKVGSLRISRAANENKFGVDIRGHFDLKGFGSLDGENLAFAVRGLVDFTGIVVVPDNIFPKPESPIDAENLVSKFIGTQHLAAPEWDRFRYVLRPE